MRRKYIDCRQIPNKSCSVAISGSEEEVLDPAVNLAGKPDLSLVDGIS
jgi:hypothetical protein